ncbi:Isochorismatase-like protein [Xylariales sp. PMI_506]|nr:Isochorismatase-like protein [Xylariales sp. PMI_506]
MAFSTPRRRALFLIDVQNELAADASSKVPRADELLSALSSILAAARGIIDVNRREDQPKASPFILVIVQHEEKPEDGNLVRDTDPWRLVFEPRLDVNEEWLVSKTTRNTFTSNPDLASRLREADIEEVIAFGIQSECCVESTCKGALDAGLQVTLLSGAHSTYDCDGKTAIEIERDVEGRLLAQGVSIVKWDDAIKEWANMSLP